MVSILLAPELYKQIHQPFGCIRLFLKNVRAKAENKSYRGKGMPEQGNRTVTS